MLANDDRHTLLAVARRAISHGLETGKALAVDSGEFSEPLRARRATFVTLERGGDLRGCIGTLEASRPLVQDVAANAYAAAFSDPRFPPLAAAELPDLTVRVSVLSPPAPLHFDSEADLVGQLRVGVDGLILEEGAHRGTFLPSVWESLSNPHAFLEHLKLKAGLAPGYWSPTLRAWRYTTESFGEQD
jgi:AmmeMemoRadiSam system protein A